MTSMSKDIPWLVGKVRLFCAHAHNWSKLIRFPVWLPIFLSLHFSFCCVLRTFLFTFSCLTMSLLGQFDDYWCWRYRHIAPHCSRVGRHTHSFKDGGRARMRVTFLTPRSCDQYQRMLTCLLTEANRIEGLPGTFDSSPAKVHDAKFWLYHCHDFRNRYGEVLVPSLLRRRWRATERALHLRLTVWSINIDRTRDLNCHCVSPEPSSVA